MPMEPSHPLNPDRVQELMGRREMSRQELCSETGISESYLSRIFNRRIQVTKAALIARFAEALGVDAGVLTTRPEAPILRVAVPPHLWSAPFLNRSEEDGAGSHGLEILEGDQSFTGGDALAALRRGAADLALSFETPLDMTDDSDVLILGAICAGTDYVRLLMRRDSPLLGEFKRFDTEGALPEAPEAELPAAEDAEPIAAIHGETIAVEYLRRLEEQVPGLDRLRLAEPDPERPWLDRAGRRFHMILIWEPVASAIVAAASDAFVDVFDALPGRLPSVWLPPPADYQLLISQARPLPGPRLRQLVKDLQAVVLEMNHYIGKSRLVLHSQPVIDRLVGTLPYTMNDVARARLRRLLTRRLGDLRFHLRLRPEVITTGLL